MHGHHTTPSLYGLEDGTGGNKGETQTPAQNTHDVVLNQGCASHGLEERSEKYAYRGGIGD